jgi:hypothetical protein
LRVLLAADNVCFRLDVCRVTGHRCLNNTLEFLDNDTVLAQLFLHKNDLFGSADNEVSSGINRTFIQETHVGLGPSVEHAFATSQHHGHSTDHDVSSHSFSSRFRVDVVDVDRCSVGHVSESAFVGGDVALAVAMDIVFHTVWQTDSNVGELDVFTRVCIADNQRIGLNDFLKLNIGEVIERVDVLFDKTLHSQESGKKVPLVASSVDGIR